MACVQGFGGSKSIVGSPLRSHSLQLSEQPPDHTRRREKDTEELSNIDCLLRRSECEDLRHQETD